jgi:cyclohexanecarboxylate-CoA ligase
VMPIFRGRELKQMLAFAESKVLVVPAQFRGFDHAGLAQEMKREIPTLDDIFIVGGNNVDSFTSALATTPLELGTDTERRLSDSRPDPDQVILLQFTSGTTGKPKGVMHTSNTLLAFGRVFSDAIDLTRRDVMFMASPLGHGLGYLYGVLTPCVAGARTVLQDVWEPRLAARRMIDEGATHTGGATPFLADLVETPEALAGNITTLRIFVASGAPIPHALAQQAAGRLGAAVLSGFGMTELSTTTLTSPIDPQAKAFSTDGRALRGMAVRVVDEGGSLCPHNQQGHLQARGAFQFVGYLKEPDLNDVDPDGWFDTGDLATMDDDGYIRITGRLKDIIIRGGENVPVVEIEGLLFTHPAIKEVAIVGMPDARLGERGCAFIKLREGQALTLGDIVDFLQSHKVTKQFMPERLEIVDELPRTPSGKVRKFVLREWIINRIPGPGGLHQGIPDPP